MSRGPGRIERAIEAAFTANPDLAFTVPDLAALAFPGLNQLEKKHRVSVLRAAYKALPRCPDWGAAIAGWVQGYPAVFFNQASVPSYCLMRVICMGGGRHGRQDALAGLEPDGGYHRSIASWSRFVDIYLAQRDGDTERATAIEAGIERERAVLAGAIGGRR